MLINAENINIIWELEKTRPHPVKVSRANIPYERGPATYTQQTQDVDSMVETNIDLTYRKPGLFCHPRGYFATPYGN